jgi:hypothetical protein
VSDQVRQVLPFLFFLPFGLFVAAMIAIQARLASKLHRLAPQGMSRFQCFHMISAPIMRSPASVSWRDPFNPYASQQPRVAEATKEFRERAITYRLILFAMAFLLMPLMGGALIILSRIAHG